MRRIMRNLLTVGVALMGIAIPAHVANAAGSGLSVAQCFSSTDENVTGCTPVTGGSPDLFERGFGVVLAPNGKTLYVSTKAGVSWWSVDSSGALTYQGCLDCDATSDPANRPRVTDSPGIAVAPDGSALYVSTDADGGALERFTIGNDGTPTFASCIDYGGDGGNCVDGPDVGYETRSLLVSSDSSDVYLADGFSKVAIGSGGTMSVAACLVEAATTGCTTVDPGDAGAVGSEILAFAPDGSIYATSNGTLTHFDVTGSMSVLSCATVNSTTSDPDYADCGQLSSADVGDFDNGRMAINSTGTRMLISDDYELAKFDLGTGSTAPAFDACYGVSGIAPAACSALGSPTLAEFDEDQPLLSPDGSTLYAGTADGIDVFSLDSSMTPTVTGCIGQSMSCDQPDPANSLDEAVVLTESSSGQRLYVSTDSDNDFATLDEVAIAGSAPTTIATTTTLKPSARAIGGVPVKLTATVTPDSGTTPPTGTVEFKAGGAVISGCGSLSLGAKTPDQAICKHAFTGGTEQQLSATYSGSSGFTGSTGTANLSVLPATTKTTLSAATSKKFETLEARVTAKVGKPGGDIKFSNGGKALKGCASVKLDGLNGKASCGFSIKPGHYSFTATYLGSKAYATSTSPKRSVTIS